MYTVDPFRTAHGDMSAEHAEAAHEAQVAALDAAMPWWEVAEEENIHGLPEHRVMLPTEFSSADRLLYVDGILAALHEAILAAQALRA